MWYLILLGLLLKDELSFVILISQCIKGSPVWAEVPAMEMGQAQRDVKNLPKDLKRLSLICWKKAPRKETLLRKKPTKPSESA